MNIEIIWKIIIGIIFILSVIEYTLKIYKSKLAKKEVKLQKFKIEVFLLANGFITLDGRIYTNEVCRVDTGLDKEILITDDRVETHLKEHSLERIVLEYFIGVMVTSKLIKTDLIIE